MEDSLNDSILRLLKSKQGWVFLIEFIVLFSACYSLITKNPIAFTIVQPFEYTISLSEWSGWALLINACGGLLLAQNILPGLKSPLIQCPACKKAGAYVKFATYHCEDCGTVTPVGTTTATKTNTKRQKK